MQLRDIVRMYTSLQDSQSPVTSYSIRIVDPFFFLCRIPFGAHYCCPRVLMVKVADPDSDPR